MNWIEILQQIFETVIIPLLGIATLYIIFLVKSKINELKQNTSNKQVSNYLSVLDKIITEAVIATNQTYVDALKEKNAFDIEAQKEAFQMCFDAVVNILTDDLKNALELIIGDLESYIKNKIEAEVSLNKF